MGIASVNCDLLALTEECSMLEFDITMIETERQHLTLKGGHLYEEYTHMMEKQAIAAGNETDAEEDTVEEFNWEEFKDTYELAQTRLNNQDKYLEMEKSRKQTKLTMLNNLKESEQKRLEKNVESELKGIGS